MYSYGYPVYPSYQNNKYGFGVWWAILIIIIIIFFLFWGFGNNNGCQNGR